MDDMVTPVVPAQAKKKWYQSRVIQLAIGQAMVGIVVVLTTQFPDIGWIAIAKSILDIGLRFLTDLPVE